MLPGTRSHAGEKGSTSLSLTGLSGSILYSFFTTTPWNRERVEQGCSPSQLTPELGIFAWCAELHWARPARWKTGSKGSEWVAAEWWAEVTCWKQDGWQDDKDMQKPSFHGWHTTLACWERASGAANRRVLISKELALSNDAGWVRRWRGNVAYSDRPCKLWPQPQTKGQSSHADSVEAHPHAYRKEHC